VSSSLFSVIAILNDYRSAWLTSAINKSWAHRGDGSSPRPRISISFADSLVRNKKDRNYKLLRCRNIYSFMSSCAWSVSLMTFRSGWMSHFLNLRRFKCNFQVIKKAWYIGRLQIISGIYTRAILNLIIYFIANRIFVDLINIVARYIKLKLPAFVVESNETLRNGLSIISRRVWLSRFIIININN